MPPKRVHKRPPKPAPKPITPDEPEAIRFNADAFLYSWGPHSLPQHNGFRAAIEKAFDIDPTSDYVYRADPAAVTLPQAQVAIDHGSARGFHAFYLDENGLQVGCPSFLESSATERLIDTNYTNSLILPIPLQQI